MKILVIHPEGNIHNNPNLSGMVGILCENGHDLEIISPRRPHIFQGNLDAGAKLTLVDNPWNHGPFIFSDIDQSRAGNIRDVVNSRIADCDFIFGVDIGILDAAVIANVKNIPYGLISYEIFFADEIGSENKQWEINACRNAALAICQDRVRSEHLSRENRIPLEKIINIPVVGRKVLLPSSSHVLHDRLNIDTEAKIALYMGSLQDWAMTDYLIQSAVDWPEDWCLVLHSRYSGEEHKQEYGTESHADILYRKYNHHPRIVFSREPFERQRDMTAFICSADAGVSLYKATHDNMYTGKNLEFIGMDSGKSIAYLQHGIPLITNDQGEMGRLVRDHRLGMVIDDSAPFNVSEITPYLEEFRSSIPAFAGSCLDLEALMLPVLQRLDEIQSGKK